MRKGKHEKKLHYALLQIINRHVLKRNLLSTINIILVGKNANGHARAGNSWKFNGSRETLVTLGVVVLETNLKFDGLYEVAVIVLGRLEKLLDGTPHA